MKLSFALLTLAAATCAPSGAVYEMTDTHTYTGSNRLQLAQDASHNLQNDFTISVKVYPTQRVSDWARVLGKGDSSNRNYGLWIRSDGAPLAQVYGVNSGHNAWTGGNQVPLNAWTTMGMRYQINGYNSLWINGVKLTETRTTGTPAQDNNDGISLGGANFHTQFIGQLKDAFVYGSALTDAQMGEMDTCTATDSPTKYPTPSPTNYPTPSPTNYPTPSPTNYPTPSPTNYPTPAPTGILQHATCQYTVCSYSNGQTDIYSNGNEKFHCEKYGNGCRCVCHSTLKCALRHHHTSGYKKTFEHC